MVIHHENNIHNNFPFAVNYKGHINWAFYVSTTMNFTNVEGRNCKRSLLQSRNKDKRCMVSQACVWMLI